MEYRSPLGYNFKLEKSFSAVKEEKDKNTHSRDDFMSLDSSGSQKSYDYDNRRYSGGHRNNSPAWQRSSGSWKSPKHRNSQQEEPVPIEQYYHPSMLENPWEELENDLKTGSANTP